MHIKTSIHNKILSNKSRLNEWFDSQSKDLCFPFYSSIDIRDSGSKIVPVDSNLFPAGFNNICKIDYANIATIAKNYLSQHYPHSKSVALLIEEHTNNPYYIENVYSLLSILKESDFKVFPCVLGQNINPPLVLESATGKKVEVFLLSKVISEVDFVICNNDFSIPYNLPKNKPINPIPDMGWHFRKKNWFFEEYNPLAIEFAKILDLNPWHVTIKTEHFKGFNLDNKDSMSYLKERVQDFLEDLQLHYKNTSNSPYAFLKNNSGTYGLGVTYVTNSKELDEWNYKTRKKMKSAKGGQPVKELIIQEGIPTQLSYDNSSSEPVIYMLGKNLIGGFLRTHKEKGKRENLNSPGAVYRELCMSHLSIREQTLSEENVYGWISKISALALAKEIKNRIH